MLHRLKTLLLLITLLSAPAAAQPLLSASTVMVQPGAAVTLTLSGRSGDAAAIFGSTVNAGVSYGGQAL